MLGSTRNTATQLFRRVAARSLSTEAAPASASSMVTLNFNVPHETIYKGASVYSVIIPGVEGEYGVTGGHVGYVAQLKPGVLQILHEEGSADPEKYFVAGGYAMTHPDSTTVRSDIIIYL
jgi:F0F1-type ATP synthase epsilon subunit